MTFELKDFPAEIMFTYNGKFEECPGRRKRKMNEEQRDRYTTMMLKEKYSASRIHMEEATRLMKPGDEHEPSNLPTKNALRLMKSRKKNEGHLHSNAILALGEMMEHQPYSCIFKDIGYKPFFLHYWSSAQINAYRIYTRQTKIPCVSIDATGGLVQRVRSSRDVPTKVIFFYEIDSEKGIQFPVANMLSERQHNTAIAFWLLSWLREDICGPRICVTDQSRALMQASAHAFTQYPTLIAYLSACSSLLLRQGVEVESQVEVPHCMLRNDFAHVMKIFSTWDEIKNAAPRTKNFYMRSAALLVGCTSFDNIKVLYECLFRVLLNEVDGPDDYSQPAPCHSAKLYLKQCIAGMEESICDNDLLDLFHNTSSDDLDNDVHGEDCGRLITSLYDTINEIYEICFQESVTLNESVSDRLNAQFCPTLAKKFLQYTELLPIWSGIMVPIFGFGRRTHSSSASESLFKELKEDIFGKESLPLRVDEFIEIHVHTTNGRMLIVNAQQSESRIDNDENDFEDNTNLKIQIKEPEAFENWRGQAEKKGTKKNGKIEHLNSFDNSSPIEDFNETLPVTEDCEANLETKKGKPDDVLPAEVSKKTKIKTKLSGTRSYNFNPKFEWWSQKLCDWALT